MRNKFNQEYILSLCKDVDCGMLTPPMDAQVALEELKRYFLGDDWYFVGPGDAEQGNMEIVCAIQQKYRGIRIKKCCKESKKLARKDVNMIFCLKCGNKVVL